MGIVGLIELVKVLEELAEMSTLSTFKSPPFNRDQKMDLINSQFKDVMKSNKWTGSNTLLQLRRCLGEPESSTCGFC